MGSYSVIAGDRCFEAFNLELEEKLGIILVNVNGNSFPNQILFETLYLCWIRRHILNCRFKISLKIVFKQACIIDLKAGTD